MTIAFLFVIFQMACRSIEKRAFPNTNSTITVHSHANKKATQLSKLQSPFYSNSISMTDLAGAIYRVKMVWYTAIKEFIFTGISIGLHRIDFHASLRLPALIKKLIIHNSYLLTHHSKLLTHHNS